MIELFGKKRFPKEELIERAFRAGGICLEKKRGTGDKARTITVLPLIKDVQQDGGVLDVRFTIPVEINPADVYKKIWAFENVFESFCVMENTYTHFRLKMFPSGIPSEVLYPVEGMPELKELGVPILCGKDHTGWYYYDMVDFPHICIAGETGSGKSNQFASLLTTIITHKTPQEVKLYLADLKGSEFHSFTGVEHVVRNADDVDGLREMVQELVAERESRAKLLTQHKVKHVKHLPDDARVPYIVVGIDEVKLLGGKDNKDLLDDIHNISTVGRSLGIYFIMAMQRPDANVINGDMKNNLTIRMAFKHADQINYRITLGEDGAPKEIMESEKGRFWMKMDGYKLLQAPYLEISKDRDQARELVLPFVTTTEE